MFNSKLLKKTIEESGYKLRFIAEKLGVTYQALLNKTNGFSEFKNSEINALCVLLRLSNDKRDEIFFANKVD